MGLNSLVFDGVNLYEEYNCKIASETVWDAPARDVDSYTVPGRNGTVLVDNGRFENIDIKYKCFCDRSDSTKADALREFLTSRKGYRRLEDGYHPGEYRLASFRSGLKFDISGETELVFDCKPQRFIDSTIINATGGTTIVTDRSDSTYSYEQLPEKEQRGAVSAYGENAYAMRFKHFTLTPTAVIRVAATSPWAMWLSKSTDNKAGVQRGTGDKVINNLMRYTDLYCDENTPFRLINGQTVLFARTINTVNADNPTRFEAFPLIKATVNGAYDGIIATVNGVSVTGKWTADDVAGVTAVAIDCEICDAYGLTGDGFESVNMNKYVTIPDGFKLTPGSNIIGAGLDLVIDRRLYTI